jgi:hypothetical protein
MRRRTTSVEPSAPTPLTIAAMGVVALLASLATVTQADFDLWGHLRFGFDILLTQDLPADDPYSFRQDRPWINHEWLSELQMAVAYSLAGVAGLALLKGGLVASTLGLVWLSWRDVRTDTRIVCFAAVAVAAVPAIGTLRPQLWTLLFLAVLCRVLVAADARAIRWLPLLFVVWANCHGGWIVGFGMLALWFGLTAVLQRRAGLEPALVLLGCAAATLCTPYGWRLWEFLATTVSLQGRAITEWQPLWNAPVGSVVTWVGTALAAVVLSIRSFPHRVATLGVLALLAYASLNVVRIVPLFALCSGVLLSGALRGRWPSAPAIGKPATRSDLAAAMIIVAIGIGGSVWVLTTSLRCVRVLSPGAADALAVRRLADAVPGRVVTFFDWGQYAIWHLGPRLRVSMDGRRETVYSNDRLEEHGAILNGTPAGFDTLAEWQPEYVWLPAASAATKHWLLEHGYRVEHDTKESFVAVRGDLPRLRAPRIEDPSRVACFPG